MKIINLKKINEIKKKTKFLRQENILDSVLDKISLSRMTTVLKEEWNEMSEEYDDVDLIVTTLEEAYLKWIGRKVENKLAFYELMYELTEKSSFEKGKRETLDYLTFKISK